IPSWVQAGVARTDGILPWKDRGVYLISGGAGGLGMIFAEEITQRRAGVRLILSGRSPLDAARRDALNALGRGGAQVEYQRVDVAVENEVAETMGHIREKWGRLDGIIPSAGLIRDSFIL